MLSVMCAVFLAAADASDGEVWNEGVDFFRKGDVTNALRVVRPLMASKTHGARAAELVAKLEYDRGNLEEAADAAQIALRANPEEERAVRNFTRAVDRLPEIREAKRVEALLRASHGKDPGSLLQSATYDARTLMAEAGTYRTNAASKVVARADALSRRAQKLADVWIPVREAIVQAVTNQEQASTIVAQIEQAESQTKRAADELADIKGEAYGTLSDVEHAFTRFLKLTALPPAALGEDFIAQSNAWQDAEVVNGRNWQQDALDYTRAFRAKFPAWARAYEQQAQVDTNKPPFKTEDQARISALATNLEKIQLECCEKLLPPRQEEAVRIIREMQELLPKDKSQGQGGGAGQPPPQKQPDPKQDQQQQQNQEQSQNDHQQESAPEEQPKENDEAKPSEQDKTDDEKVREESKLEATLKKAQERNDEHEAEKKARMRKAPLPPNERDW